MDHPPKRRRVGTDEHSQDGTSPTSDLLPHSLTQPVSPPRRKARPQQIAPTIIIPDDEPAVSSSAVEEQATQRQVFKSPFQLTWIRDLPESANTDAVTLSDLLSDPLISELYEFNYLHDIDFLMAALDEDVRDSVRVHVVHGFWKKEDPSRSQMIKQAQRYKNVQLHCASMPGPWGTHHSKMLIVLRHDDTAQVVIHTANMIERDWTNMTQSLWRSPLLPLRQPAQTTNNIQDATLAIGSGERFKRDLLNYLKAYNRTRPVIPELVKDLEKYDFSAVKAAVIASVPGHHQIYNKADDTKWGWAALKDTLRHVSVQEGKSEIVVQISSIATLGSTDSWLRGSLFQSLKASKNKVKQEPQFKVVFPTPDEIRRSLDGYNSGASIHTKIQSTQQAKQLQYLKPMLHHWANDAEQGPAPEAGVEVHEAGRQRAAPHIKTYIRYGETSVDWALTTSANMSKQAWGSAVGNKTGEVWIASWEIGVLVWPSLFANNARMVGTFGQDTPNENETSTGAGAVVGLRIPYNVPLQAYGADEKPWVATASYFEPDDMGQRWVS
ncbi:tyrosyl-DNA phosphodiesterase [Coniella lustricola]|uniref:Tyrosyl-DNA phosphodiesterase n=1 Tax=Coniella lustricola TaxID=2025994 RepID=A0A2T3AD44_9PEZI|nr:tyrosyl-DNA phosphodiesterase [Coniella lustricola]